MSIFNVNEIYFILAGIVVGFSVGVTGVGGGSLMTPILISLLGIPAQIAIGTDLLYASASKLCGSAVHAKKLNIVWPVVIWLAVGSIPASLITSWVLHHYLSGSNEYKHILTLVLGFMLTLTGVSIVFRKQIEAFFQRIRLQKNKDTSFERDDYSHPYTVKNNILVLIMGIVLGILVTLSSVGAGAFGVMALVLLFPNLPMIRIIGSDVAHAVLLTLVAGLGHLFSGNVDFHLLVFLLIGAIPAIIIGTLISSALPEHFIRFILGITLVLLGINFLIPSKTPEKAPSAASVLAAPNANTQLANVAASLGSPAPAVISPAH